MQQAETRVLTPETRLPEPGDVLSEFAGHGPGFTVVARNDTAAGPVWQLRFNNRRAERLNTRRLREIASWAYRTRADGGPVTLTEAREKGAPS